MILLVMGVTGSGKSTAGMMLAQRLGWRFVEADDYHSAANKEKMHRGIPLTDADRFPWLDRIHEELCADDRRDSNVVLACSALKEEYRRHLLAGLSGKVLYLRGSFDLIRRRIEGRSAHFAGEAILADQFANLEEPTNALVEDVFLPPEEIVERAMREWNLQPTTQLAPAVTLSKLRWRLLPFLFLLYVVAYLDRVNLSFAATQMKGELGLSDTVLGLGAGIFFLGYFLFQVPSNMVLERVGARRWIPCLMLLWGVISSATMFVRTEHGFYWMRFLLGAAEAGFFPGVTFYLRQWFPPGVRAGVMAMFMAAGPLSGVIGAPLSGSLLNLHLTAGLSGWQWMFLLEGIPALLLAAVAFFYLPETPEVVSWLTWQEKDWLRQSTGEPERDAKGAPRPSAASWAWVVAPVLWALAFVDFALNTCTYGVSLWLPTALQPFAQSSNVLLGFLAAVPNLVAVVLMIVVATHSDHVGERRWHLAGAAVAGAIGLALAGSAASAVPILAGFSLALAASSSMAGIFWALANDHLSPLTAARSIALINAVGNLGGGLGPYWIGHLRDTTGGFRAGLFAVALLMLLASATTVLTGHSRKAAVCKAAV